MFHKISGIESLCRLDVKKEGVSRFFVNFLVSHWRKISYVNFLYCQKFRVSRRFMLKGVISRLSIDLFCLSVPESFVGEPFYDSQNFWYRKILWIRGGGGEEGVSRFFVQHFLSDSTAKLPGVTLFSVIIFGYRESFCLRGLRHVFRSKFFLSRSSDKLPWWTLLCSVSKNLG